jgi:type III secretory pathway component EscV
MTNLTTKIKQKLLLYALIKTLSMMGQSVIIGLCVGLFLYLLFTFPIVVFTILFAIIFLLLWVKFYDELSKQREKEMSQKLEQYRVDNLKKHIEKLTDAYYQNTEHTQEEKENYQKELLEKALGTDKFYKTKN